MPEQVPGAMLCPECGRDMGSFIYRLIELHPHASDLTEQKAKSLGLIARAFNNHS